MITYMQFIKQHPEYDVTKWRDWLLQHKDESKTPCEVMGLLQQELDDLANNIHSIYFYIEKKKHIRSIYRLWPGCYVKFLAEHNNREPLFQYGWIDAINVSQGFCKIQCDDSFCGSRALTIRIIDIMQILPYKQRYLVYYKTMICGNCNNCDRTSNKQPPISCPHFQFFNDILSKQKNDQMFLNIINNREK